MHAHRYECSGIPSSTLEPATLTADCPGEKLKAGTGSTVVQLSESCVVFSVRGLVMKTPNFFGESQLLIDRKDSF